MSLDKFKERKLLEWQKYQLGDFEFDSDEDFISSLIDEVGTATLTLRGAYTIEGISLSEYDVGYIAGWNARTKDSEDKLNNGKV